MKPGSDDRDSGHVRELRGGMGCVMTPGEAGDGSLNERHPLDGPPRGADLHDAFAKESRA